MNLEPENDLPPKRRLPGLSVDLHDASEQIVKRVNAAAAQSVTRADFLAFLGIIDDELRRPKPNDVMIYGAYERISEKVCPLWWKKYCPTLNKLYLHRSPKPQGPVALLWRLPLVGPAPTLTSLITPPDEVLKTVLELTTYTRLVDYIAFYANSEGDKCRQKFSREIHKMVAAATGIFPAFNGNENDDFRPLLRDCAEGIAYHGRSLVETMNEMEQPGFLFCGENPKDGWLFMKTFCNALDAIDPNLVNTLGAFAFFLPSAEVAFAPDL